MDVVVEESGGKKCDGGKPRWELLDLDFIEEIVKVRTYGAERYDEDNWKLVSVPRYIGACFRHLKLFVCGETHDSESGYHHLAHLGCNIMFLYDLVGGDDSERE